MVYEFYRTSLIGKALVETIDEKVKNSLMTPEQAHFILQKFDEAIPRAFEGINNSMNFKGKIVCYNYVDGVWQFICKDFKMSLNNKYYQLDYLKIVACDADTNADNGRRRRVSKK